MTIGICDRYQVLTGKQWELLELLLPKSEGHVDLAAEEGMLHLLRTSLPWRDLPERFAPGQAVRKRYRR
ncbi:transposase [Nocardia gamkensis]|uniref:transposase n=1 Tax=Nocardia gamkensis TaxID=352869 RepID=UPI0037CA9F80